MKIPKPVALGAIAAVATAFALAGCTSADPDAPAEGEIGGTLTIVFDTTFQSALEPVIEAFEERYPDVTVEVDYQGGDIPSVTSTQLQAGTAPDIFLTYPGGSPTAGGGMNNITVGSQGLAADLADSSWADDIPESRRVDVEYDGAIYAYPGALQGLGPIYNVTKVEELGLEIPTTWDELLAFCGDARDKGVAAYAAGLGDAPHFIYLSAAAGLVYSQNPDFDKDQLAGDVTFQGSPWEDVFQIYVDMNDAGCFQDGVLGATRTQSGELVASGQALAVVDVGAGLASVSALNPDIELVITPFPATNDPESNWIPSFPGYTLSVNAASENIPTAKAFLEVLNENRGVYGVGFASAPVIPDPSFEAPAGLALFNEAVADGRTAPLTSWPGSEMQAAAQAQVQAIVLGQQTVDGALQVLQDLFDQSNVQ